MKLRGAVAAVVLVSTVAACGEGKRPSGCGRDTPALADGESTSVVVRFDREGRMVPLNVHQGLYGPVESQTQVRLIDAELPPTLGGETRPGKVVRRGMDLELAVADEYVQLARYRCD